MEDLFISAQAFRGLLSLVMRKAQQLVVRFLVRGRAEAVSIIRTEGWAEQAAGTRDHL